MLVLLIVLVCPDVEPFPELGPFVRRKRDHALPRVAAILHDYRCTLRT